ncbi:MAG: alcohol dehydrogenase catalytic domain-containing protein [Enterobacter hormaechei]|nr:alcohol dehydrogenase catalytic domain-containing protein [Enterobacter hormaechei]
MHLYRGKIPKVQHGDIFGHEFMGEVVECGSEVKNARCLATAIFTAACRADRRSMCASRKATWGRLKCPSCCLTTKRFSCQIFCLPPGRRQKMRRSRKAPASPYSGPGRWGY